MTAQNEDIEQELIDDIAAFQHDPLGFVLYVFPWGEPDTELAEHEGPRTWQAEALTEISDRLKAGMNTQDAVRMAVQLAVASGHGIGKSALVSWVILWAISSFEDTKGVVTANTESQLKTKTWAEVAKWHRLAINQHWFKFTATALFSTDPKHEKTWRIDQVPWSEKNSEAFAGLHNQGRRVLLIFDEASAIPDAIWEVAEGALTDDDTEIIWCAFGNPTRNTGRFKQCFGKFKHRWIRHQIDSRTVEGTNKAQLQAWVDDHGEDSDFVKVRVRGMFPSASAKQFFNLDTIDAAYGKHLREEDFSWAPKIISVDPAWEGDDEMVIGMRQGLAYRILRTIGKNDNDVQVANMIARIEDDEGADAVFIDGGYGTGIVSAGRTMGRHHWQLVWFSEASSDPGCLNKRAQMYNDCKKWLKEGGAIPADAVLHEEMCSVESVPRLDGKIQIEAKKDLKRRGLPSPNRLDNLVITFAYPVVSKELGGATVGHANTDFDPFSE